MNHMNLIDSYVSFYVTV